MASDDSAGGGASAQAVVCGNGGAAALASMALAVPLMLGRAGAENQEKRCPPRPPVVGGWQPHPFLSMLFTRVQAQPLLPLHPSDRD